jgi:transcriptional regulator with XRE-family HTH domain
LPNKGVAVAGQWFRDELEKFVKICGNKRIAAERLNTSHVNVGRYLRGEHEPSLDVAERLIQAVGGDIARALPNWDRATSENSELTYLRRRHLEMDDEIQRCQNLMRDVVIALGGGLSNERLAEVARVLTGT